MSEIIRACKHWLRGQLVATTPRTYWRYRVWRRGDEEPELGLLPALCDPSRSGTVVDIGANYGMYLSRLVELGQRCIAFEPIPRLAKMLRRGFRARAEVHAVALSGEGGGEVTLRLPRLRTGYATVEPANELSSLKSPTMREVKVPRRTLDDYGLVDASFIKIDVEGHEEQVLVGAQQTLARCGPTLLVEVEDRHNPGSIGRICKRLERLDYEAYVIHDRELRSLTDFDLCAHQRATSPEHYVRNVIGVAPQRRDAVVERIRNSLSTTAW